MFFDDNFQMYAYKMKYLNVGWNNLIMKVDNIKENVRIYINRKEVINESGIRI